MRILIVEVDAALRRFVRAAAEEETSGGALSSARTMVGSAARARGADRR